MDCPDQNSEEFKNLAKEVGVKRATDIYINNDGSVPKGVNELVTGEIKDQVKGHGNDVPSKDIQNEAYYGENKGQVTLTKNHTPFKSEVFDLNGTDAAELSEKFLHESGLMEYEQEDFNEVQKVKKGGNIASSIQGLFTKLMKSDRIRSSLGGEVGEYSNKVLESEIDFAIAWAKEAGESDLQKMFDYINAIKLNDMKKVASLKIELNEKMVFDTIIKANIRLHKIKMDADSLYDGEGNSYSVKEVSVEASDEAHKQNTIRERSLNKFPRFRGALEKLEKYVRYTNNARLIGKNLTGSDKSNFTNIIWKAFYKASGKMYKLQNDFISEVRVTSKESLNKMSLYNNPVKSIDEIDAQEIELFNGQYVNGKLEKANAVKTKLTQAELATLYMNIREQKGDESDPRNIIVNQNNGFYLRDSLGDRSNANRFHLGTTLEQREAKAKEIIKLVESNKELMELIGKADSAISKRHSEVNKPYSQITGWNLEEIPNYFPTRFGKKKKSVKTTHMAVQKLGSIIERKPSDKYQALQVGDIFEVLDSYNLSTSHYASYTIPVSNANKLLDSLSKNMDEETKENFDPLLKQAKTFVIHNEDPGNLFKSEGESDINRIFNKFNNTFALSVLGWNIPVMAKQTASFQLAKESIDGRYLKQAGWGAAGLVGINPSFVMKSLIGGKRLDGSLIPLSWRADETNPTYVEIMNNSDILNSRFGGFVSREMGEFAMGSKFGNEKIRLNIKGKKVEIDRQRFMEGIKIFDTATVIAIWKATKAEVLDQTDLAEGSPEFMNRVRERSEEIIAKTQPTFDNANRMEISLSNNPVMRMVTMFTSATSKMGQLNIESLMDYINEPTNENKLKLRKRLLNTTLGVGTHIAAINILWGAGMAILGGDDEKFEQKLSGENYMKELFKTSAAQFPLLRELYSGMASRLDKEFWKDDMAVPALEYINKAQDGLGYGTKWMINGKAKDGYKFYNTFLDVFAQGKGLPVSVGRLIKIDTK